MTRLLSTLLLSLVLAVSTASAEVVRIEITSRSEVADGKPYGLAGAFERIEGTIYFAVDPNNPANRIITDIDYAPRNADGKVEFRSDFYLIKPKDITRGNGTLFYEVSNRGGKGMLGYYNNARGSRAPQTDEDMGDGFLLEHGFTLLWVGWQFDVPLGGGRVRVFPPIATDNGTPITGLVRSEVIVGEVAYDRSLADRNHQAYEVADPSNPANVMTVRDTVDGERRVVPRDRWRFARRTDSGEIVTDRTRVSLEGGFQPHKLNDVVYVDQDPPLVGLGPAAVRDTISYLNEERYRSRAEYLGRVSDAALALVEDGYLLTGDLSSTLTQAARHRRSGNPARESRGRRDRGHSA